MTTDAPTHLPDGRPSELTLLGLVQHLAECERNWFQRVVGVEVSMRWVLIHMIEEYARHNGHADILRECIDGVTGA
ncbi:DinB family protein [Streptomyces sp. NBC_01614]|uniref:DinB family protein n=1 Tax=Streptomyces sp. NBC_00180 TaxID=2903632 RepID=A0AAU1I781_9ACTN